MRFLVEYRDEDSEDVLFNNTKKIYYIKNEYSFSYYPSGDFFSIPVGCLNMIFNSDGILLAFDGFMPQKSWKRNDLVVPDFVERRVYSYSEYTLSRIEGSENWEAFFDDITGWFCFGDLNSDAYDHSLKCPSNSGIVINRGKLKSVWIKPVFKEGD